MKKVAIYLSVLLIVVFLSGCITYKTEKNISEKITPYSESSEENVTPEYVAVQEENVISESNVTSEENKTLKYTGMIRTIYMTIYHTRYDPDFISVNKGDLVRIMARSEYTDGKPHGFTIKELGINVEVTARIDQPPQVIEFVADTPGYYEFTCGTCPSYFPEIKGRMNIMGG